MWTDSRKTKRQKTVIRKRTSRGFLFFLLFCTILLNGLSGKNAQAASCFDYDRYQQKAGCQRRYGVCCDHSQFI